MINIYKITNTKMKELKNQGVSMRQIAKQLGCNIKTVAKWSKI